MKKEVIILLAIVGVIAIAGVVGASYYRTSVQKPLEPGKKIPEELLRTDVPAIGPVEAKVTVVEFYDPECETCAAFHPVVKGLLKEFEGKIRVVSRYATFHKNARLAATYTEAAGEQGKYWEMQEKLFEKQGEWGEKHGAAPTAPPVAPTVLFENYAKELGMNVDQLKASVADPKHGARIDRDMRDVDTLKVMRTPTFYVNGRLLAKLSQPELRALIMQELAK
ncbi:MAG: thioredoxin domain-containing protein [Acidobacteria bacterium]|nr:thioredoxin domain-containing protein [Acidobacteriota bacterium]